MLHDNGQSVAEYISDRFAFDVSIKIDTSTKVFTATSGDASSISKFSSWLEDLGIHHPYCSDHMFHLTCKKLCKDVTF